MQYLKADTITEVTIGPVVAVGDGFTPVTTLSIASADEAEIIKHGATTTTAIAGTLAAITGADGYYALDLSATDTNTEGRLTIAINDDSLCLPVRHDFMVVNANVFDSLFAAATTDYLQVDTLQLAGTTQDATDLADFAAAGYDPATNKVQGVVLTDTCTTNSDKTGYSLAADQSGVTVGAVSGAVGSVTGAVGSVTGNVGGITGTLNTLDDLDTAQDAQHQITQDAIGNLGVGTGGISAVASGFTKSSTEPETNDYTDTATLGTIHIVEDVAGTTDAYYEFDLGNSGVPQSVTWQGYAQSNGDSYAISFYNWGTTSWDQVGTIDGISGTTQSVETFVPTTAHVGTGSNAGLVRFKFYSTDGTAFATDRVYCTYANMNTGIANGSTITLSATTTNENFTGHNWALVLGSQDIGGSYFSGSSDVSGTGTCSNGSPYYFDNCIMESPTLSSEGVMEDCSFQAATFTSTGGVTADEIIIANGRSKVAGSGSPAMSWGSITKETSVNIRGWLGGGTWTFASDVTASIEVYHGGGHTITTGGGDVEFRGFPRSISVVLTGGETVQIIAGTGPISISGNGTGSTVNIYGSNSGVSNTATGSPTVTNASMETDAVSTLTAANVNTEVLDVLNTDTFAEPGQGAPSATTTLQEKISYLYKAWRNKTEQTSTTLSLYDDAGTTVDQKSTVADNGTTATRGEIGTGP